MEKRKNKWLLNYINSLLPKNIKVRILDFAPWDFVEISFWNKRKKISTPAIPLWPKDFKKPRIKKIVKMGLEFINREKKHR